MQLEHALKRIGATIMKVDQKPGQVVVLLRVDPKQSSLWQDALNEFLLAAADQRVAWTTDVSKYFYVDKNAGVVRYLWRVILGVDPRSAAEALGRAAQRAVAVGVEVTSQPLVGRKEMIGKTGGAYGMNEAQTVLAQNFGGNGS
jgi:hypothetical protein